MGVIRLTALLRTCICCICLLLLTKQTGIAAEQYKYIDRNGITFWLDDTSKIPPAPRQQFKYVDTYGVTFWVDDSATIPVEYRGVTPAEPERNATPPMLSPPVAGLPPVTTKISIRNNQIIVPVLFKNRGHRVKANMILDTGASVTTIYAGVASKLNLGKNRFASATSISANGAATSTPLTKVDFIEVGDKILANSEVVVMPTQNNIGADGLLGNSFLRFFTFTIDYDKQLLIWNPVTSRK